MGDEAAAAAEAAPEGAEANVPILADGPRGGLADARIQVSNLAERACRGCGRPTGPRGGPRGWYPERCRPCRRERRRSRNNECDRQRRAANPDSPWRRPRPCRFCGVAFQPMRPRDANRAGCYECGRVGDHDLTQPCIDCGRMRTPRGSGRCHGCTNARRARSLHTCQGCGGVFRPKAADRVSFCSRECAYTYQHERRVEREQRLAASRGVLIESTCVQCGRWFAVGRARQLCSERCRVERARLKQRTYYAERLASPRVRRECLECGASFVAPTGVRFLYCAPRCGRRADKRNRKASTRQGWRSTVSRIAIVRRDRNQCRICEFQILPDSGRAWSATLDHIVPLSRGGLHREENVQLAHLVCNSTKCDESDPRWRERLDKRLRTDSPFAHYYSAEVRCG